MDITHHFIAQTDPAIVRIEHSFIHSFIHSNGADSRCMIARFSSIVRCRIWFSGSSAFGS